jgi:hypothetical protein
VKVCVREKAALEAKVSKLESENATLLSQMRKMQSCMSGLVGKAAPASSAFLILVMSLAMLMAPNVQHQQSTNRDVGFIAKRLLDPQVYGQHDHGIGTIN